MHGQTSVAKLRFTALFLVSAAVLTAQAPLACEAVAASTPILRAEGHYEQTGDVIVICTGGAAASTVQYAGLEVSTLSAALALTSRTLDQASAITEALLLIDDPPPPGNGQSEPFCSTPLTPASCQTAKIFPGTRVSASRLRFVFPFAAPGPGGERRLRLTNLRAAASQFGVPIGFAGTIQLEVSGTLTGVPAPQVTLPLDFFSIRPNVASVQASIVGLPPATPSTFACIDTNAELAVSPAAPATADGRNLVVRVAESTFPSAFRKRSLAAPVQDGDPPAPALQRSPGVGYQTETGLYGNFPGVYGNTGLAAWGSRFFVRIHGAPPGVSLFAPSLVRLRVANRQPPLAPILTGWAKRVTSGPDGAGAYSATPASTPIGGGLAPMDNLGAYYQAIYEVVQTDTTAFEEIEVPIYPAFRAATLGGGGLLNFSAGWAPLSADITGDSALTPRFANPSIPPLIVSSITACQTLSINPAAASLPAAGGSGIILVTGTASWTATANASWILAGTFFAGTMNGVTYDVGANTSTSPRTGTITIGSLTFTVNQAGSVAESIQLNPTSAQVSSAAGEDVFSVTAPGSWTAVPNLDWLTIVSTTSTQVRYRYTANPGFVPRIGAILVGTATFTLTQAASPPALGSGLRFIPVTPCRLVDTRESRGSFGQPSLAAAVARTFTVPAGLCGIPVNARAYALNLTVVPAGPLGYLTVWPTGLPQPFVSTLNSVDGRIKANAAIVPAGNAGAVSVFATNATDLVMDINGYFIEPQAGVAGLAFYPLPPCRVIDTRTISASPLPPDLARAVPVRGVCGVPVEAQAYSLNATAVPPGPLGYLTLWPTFAARPFVSTLNAPTGAIVANAAIVPAGPDGHINVYGNAPTHLVIDINGYFAPPGGLGALRFNAVTPCRVADSRNPAGALGGPVLAASQPRAWPVPSSVCGLPADAGAYSLNATVVPTAGLGFLTMWPAGQLRPVVSTLNAAEDPIMANALILPAGTAGAISSFPSDQTHLVLDVNGYFAP